MQQSTEIAWMLFSQVLVNLKLHCTLDLAFSLKFSLQTEGLIITGWYRFLAGGLTDAGSRKEGDRRVQIHMVFVRGDRRVDVRKAEK